MVELEPLLDAESVGGEIGLELLDTQNRILAVHSEHVSFNRGITRISLPIWHRAHELDQVSRIVIRARVEVERRVVLGTWKLPALE